MSFPITFPETVMTHSSVEAEYLLFVQNEKYTNINVGVFFINLKSKYGEQSNV